MKTTLILAGIMRTDYKGSGTIETGDERVVIVRDKDADRRRIEGLRIDAVIPSVDQWPEEWQLFLRLKLTAKA